jgi:hypothetical protein
VEIAMSGKMHPQHRHLDHEATGKFPGLFDLLIFVVLIILLAVIGAGAVLAQGDPGECLTTDEATLAQLVNDYRQANNLEPIPVTASLTAVAQWHVWDLDVNHPHGGDCNMHSWSDGVLWTPVCYTSDHAQASGMWDKPREITGNAYTGNGFEIAYWSSGTATPAGALSGWQGSPGHNDVILNNGIWQNLDPWPAMGVGMRDGYAVIWFGDLTDSQGTVVECGSTAETLVVWGTIKALYRVDEGK